MTKIFDKSGYPGTVGDGMFNIVAAIGIFSALELILIIPLFQYGNFNKLTPIELLLLISSLFFVPLVIGIILNSASKFRYLITDSEIIKENNLGQSYRWNLKDLSVKEKQIVGNKVNLIFDITENNEIGRLRNRFSQGLYYLDSDDADVIENIIKNNNRV